MSNRTTYHKSRGPLYRGIRCGASSFAGLQGGGYWTSTGNSGQTKSICRSFQLWLSSRYPCITPHTSTSLSQWKSWGNSKSSNQTYQNRRQGTPIAFNSRYHNSSNQSSLTFCGRKYELPGYVSRSIRWGSKSGLFRSTYYNRHCRFFRARPGSFSLTESISRFIQRGNCGRTPQLGTRLNGIWQRHITSRRCLLRRKFNTNERFSRSDRGSQQTRFTEHFARHRLRPWYKSASGGLFDTSDCRGNKRGLFTFIGHYNGKSGKY